MRRVGAEPSKRLIQAPIGRWPRQAPLETCAQASRLARLRSRRSPGATKSPLPRLGVMRKTRSFTAQRRQIIPIILKHGQARQNYCNQDQISANNKDMESLYFKVLQGANGLFRLLGKKTEARRRRCMRKTQGSGSPRRRSLQNDQTAEPKYGAIFGFVRILVSKRLRFRNCGRHATLTSWNLCM
jgi:hypothetical protein